MGRKAENNFQVKKRYEKEYLKNKQKCREFYNFINNHTYSPFIGEIVDLFTCKMSMRELDKLEEDII